MCDETTVWLHRRDGTSSLLPVGRWLGRTTEAEAALLEDVAGPVLDVGCGPGRHVAHLRDRGVDVLGIDVADFPVRLAQHRGLPVFQTCVFSDLVPSPGRWATILLLDGNIGIGGDPPGLLRRVDELLAPDGMVLAEVGSPGTPTRQVEVAVSGKDSPASEFFRWAEVGVSGIGVLSRAAGLQVAGIEEGANRWFVRLRRL